MPQALSSTGLRPPGATEWRLWRCVVRPRMVIRSSASTSAPLHEDWPKGLCFGQEVEGQAENGWVRLRKGGFGMIRHPELGPLLEEGGAPASPAAPNDRSKSTAAPDEFKLNLEALQGRWAHSVSKMGLLTVQGKSVIFDIGSTFSIEERPGGVLDMGGWIAKHDRSGSDKITWAKAGDSGELSCTWERLRLTPVLFWGIADVKLDPRLPERERVQVLELGDGRASKFSNHGSAITDTFEKKYCMHPVPIKRSVMVDNKKLTHDMFVHAGAEHLRPRTVAYPRCYTPDLAQKLISDLSLSDGGEAVLKLCNRSRGAGVVVVTARNADDALQRLLTPPAGAELKEWLQEHGSTAVTENVTFSDMWQEHCLYWWSNECPVFVAERCCHSMPVPLEPNSEDVFDGTMRVAFALRRDGPPSKGSEGPFEVDWLGGYWKLPQAAAGGESEAPEDLHDRIVSSFNSAEKRTAEVSAAHFKIVCDALTPFLPAIFEAGALRPELIARVYSEQPLFHAFALSRAAASIRTYDVPKSRALFQEAKDMVWDTLKLQESDPMCMDVRSVHSYVERNLGICCAVEGNWTQAHEFWERAIKQCPTNSTAYYLDGCYWQVTGNYMRGTECILESIALDPDFRLAYLGLSECYLLNEEFWSAMEACEACLRRFPEAAGAHLNSGQAAYKLLCSGDLTEEESYTMAARAIRSFELARSKAPDQWNAVAEDMLKACRADKAAREAGPQLKVFVPKVYGWRP